MLSAQRTLLVLDNFEQIVAAASVLGRLIDAAPSLKVLAGVAGLALALASARGIARPVATALFWGGLFLAWTNRGLGWAPVGLGAFVALAGAAAYLLRAPRPKS